MPSGPNPSGLPDAPDPPGPKNRWTRGIDRSPRLGTAAAGFGAYMAGALLSIVAVFMIIPGLLLVIGSMGSGWQGRVTGLGLVVGGAVALAVGWWLTEQYTIQRRS